MFTLNFRLSKLVNDSLLLSMSYCPLEQKAFSKAFTRFCLSLSLSYLAKKMEVKWSLKSLKCLQSLEQMESKVPREGPLHEYTTRSFQLKASYWHSQRKMILCSISTRSATMYVCSQEKCDGGRRNFYSSLPFSIV